MDAETKQSTDLVVSYAVSASGPDEELHAKLLEYLIEGYRVVTIISTPSSSFVSVTVLLTLSGKGSSYLKDSHK